MKRNRNRSAKSANAKGYRDHTISSAIKADYGKPDVRQKLSELNSTVEARVTDVTNAQIVLNESVSTKKTKSPFIVGKVIFIELKSS